MYVIHIYSLKIISIYYTVEYVQNPKPNGQENPYPDADDEELIERFKVEARFQLEREKELTQQRELLASRHSEGVYKVQIPIYKINLKH
jgi:hypothetical protein